MVGDLYVGKTSLIHRCATGPGGSIACRSGDHVAAGRGCKKSGRWWVRGECGVLGAWRWSHHPRGHRLPSLPSLPADAVLFTALTHLLVSCCRSLSPHRVPAGSSVARGLSLRPVSVAITAWSSLRAGSDGFLGPHRFCRNVFDRDYKATIGVDFEMERFEVAGIPFSLQM